MKEYQSIVPGRLGNKKDSWDYTQISLGKGYKKGSFEGTEGKWDGNMNIQQGRLLKENTGKKGHFREGHVKTLCKVIFHQSASKTLFWTPSNSRYIAFLDIFCDQISA